MDASSLLPYEDPVLPNALTDEQRTEMREAMDRVIREYGIAQELERSVSTNIAEFETSAKYMLEKVRNDLYPVFLNAMDDITGCAEREHLAFIQEIRESFQLSETKLRDAEAELKAWEANNEHRQRLEEEFRQRQEKLDAEYERSLKRVITSTEQNAKKLLAAIGDYDVQSESGQRVTALMGDIRKLNNENGQLKQALLQAAARSRHYSVQLWGDASPYPSDVKEALPCLISPKEMNSKKWNAAF